MPLLSVINAKGSPGATQSAASLAAVWPEVDRVLVEADPAGGVLAARWRLQSRPSMVDVGASLITAHDERAALDAGVQETTFLDEQLQVVCAPIQRTGASAALAKVLGQHPKLFTPSDRWVIADVGRIAPGSVAWPLLARSDAVLMVLRGDVESVLALRGLAEAIGAECGSRWAVAVVPATYDANDINGAFVGQDLHVPVLGDLPPVEPSGRGGHRRAAAAWTDLALSCLELSSRVPLAITTGAASGEDGDR
jgi:hypothetical protein